MPTTEPKRIPLPDCVKGRVYKIRCRNLKLGVFDGNEGFIGIRTKWSDRYLDTEYHWDQGEPHGTVRGVAELGVDLPENIEPKMYLGNEDKTTGRSIEYVKALKGWRFIGEQEPNDAIKVHLIANPKLFEFLDELEKQHVR